MIGEMLTSLHSSGTLVLKMESVCTLALPIVGKQYKFTCILYVRPFKMGTNVLTSLLQRTLQLW